MEIIKGVHHVEGVNANVYVKVDGEKLVVVDTGMPKNSEKVLDYVQRMGKKPEDISTIFLTHCHIDHVGSAYELKELTRAKVAIHQDDADFVSGKQHLPLPKGFAGSLFKAASSFMKFTPVQPDILLKEGDKIGGLTVIHTPGHTPGSICLTDQEARLIFVGDTLQVHDGNVTGAPRRFSLDTDQMAESIKRIAELDVDVMLSGHGEPLKSNASKKIREYSSRLNQTHT